MALITRSVSLKESSNSRVSSEGQLSLVCKEKKVFITWIGDKKTWHNLRKMLGKIIYEAIDAQ
jgi:hypothetical protein